MNRKLDLALAARRLVEDVRLTENEIEYVCSSLELFLNKPRIPGPLPPCPAKYVSAVERYEPQWPEPANSYESQPVRRSWWARLLGTFADRPSDPFCLGSGGPDGL